jgi:hypothetical protein
VPATTNYELEAALTKIRKDHDLSKHRAEFDSARQQALESFRALCADGAHPDVIEMEILSTVSAMRQIAELTVRT